MADIFISYAREDVERVRVLADALAAEGWSVFWDRTIPFGMTWRQVIGKEIDEARCVIVAWSTAAIGSTWVHEEADDGARRRILIPVLIEPVMPPIGFRSYQAADLSDWDGTTPTPVFERLIADIARLLGPPPAELEEARMRAETERKAEEAEARRRADEEESRRRAEEEAKRKVEEEERKQAEKRRKAEAEAARTETVAAAKRKAEREAERTPARPRRAAGKRIALAAIVVMAIASIGTAVLWQSSTSEEERLARHEQVAVEEEAKRKAEEQEARRREEAEAQRRAEEDAARRQAEREATQRAEAEDARRKEEIEAQRKSEETKRQAENEAQRIATEEARRRAAEEGARTPLIKAMTAELFALSNVNVRAGPGVEHRKLTMLVRGSPVKITGLAGEWFRVVLADGRPGFVFGELLGDILPADLKPAEGDASEPIPQSQESGAENKNDTGGSEWFPVNNKQEAQQFVLKNEENIKKQVKSYYKSTGKYFDYFINPRKPQPEEIQEIYNISIISFSDKSIDLDVEYSLKDRHQSHVRRKHLVFQISISSNIYVIDAWK